MTEIEILEILEEGGDNRRKLLNPAIQQAAKVGLLPKFCPNDEKDEHWQKVESIIKEFLTEAWRYSDIYKK